jgi:hypothetical protein
MANGSREEEKQGSKTGCGEPPLLISLSPSWSSLPSSRLGFSNSGKVSVANDSREEETRGSGTGAVTPTADIFDMLRYLSLKNDCR